jgi:PAS domain S-box-containing protein
LIVASTVGGVYGRLVFHTDRAYTHVMYLPIALAGFWWGLRGLPVALLMAAVVIAFRLPAWEAGSLAVDLIRIFFFFTVALTIGLLRRRGLRAEQALRQSEEKYRLLVEKNLTGILVLQGGRIRFANQRFAEMIGREAGELPGADFPALVGEEDRQAAEELLAGQTPEPPGDRRLECRFARPDGKTVWAQLSVSSASYEGGPALLVNVCNITSQKEAEEHHRRLADLARRQEEQLEHSTRLAELGEMAAAISHELNQPLTGIRNYARNAFYMIEKSVGSSEEVKANLRLISEQVDRASKIINQMRELARRSDRHFTALDVNSIIRESVEFLLPQMRLSGVEIRLDLDRNLSAILGDRIRLAQVFLNLLTNARQAMEGSPERRLAIRTYQDGTADRPVVAEIADTGKGFSPEEAGKLFVPFFTTKKSGSGTGLGLSISRSIIKDHRGTIEASGSPGAGATFRIRLPAARRAAEEDAPARAT